MIRRLFLSIGLLCLCLIASPVSVHAFDPFGGTGGVSCGGDTSSSAVCQDKIANGKTVDANNPISGPNGILLKITDIVAFAGGAAAIILIIIGSLRYITSSGDSNAVSAAKNTVVGALIGLVIIVLAASLITFVVEKL